MLPEITAHFYHCSWQCTHTAYMPDLSKHWQGECWALCLQFKDGTSCLHAESSCIMCKHCIQFNLRIPWIINREAGGYTPSLAFQHPPSKFCPNWLHAVEGATLNSMHLSTKITPKSCAVISLCKMCGTFGYEGCGNQQCQSTPKTIWQVKNEFGLDLNFVLLTCAGVSIMSGFKVTPDTIWVVCYIASAVWTPTTCDVTNYSNGWRKDVVNWCLEFGWKAMERNRHKKGHWNLSFTPEAVKYDYKSWITNMSVHNLSYKQN